MYLLFALGRVAVRGLVSKNSAIGCGVFACKAPNCISVIRQEEGFGIANVIALAWLAGLVATLLGLGDPVLCLSVNCPGFLALPLDQHV